MISVLKFTKMKTLYSLPLALLLLLGISNTTKAQQAQDDSWPRTINTSDGSVLKIYEPDPESFSGNVLKTRAAVSLIEPGKTDPVFGTYWAVATVETDRDNRRINIVSVKVPNVKFSDDIDANTVSDVKSALEEQIPNVEPDLSQDDVLATLQTNTEQNKLSKNLENNPPKIIYANRPSILVLIDGTPRLQHNDNWGLDAVVNTPFTIVKNNDGNYYLYGGNHWYSAPAATGPYNFVNNVPQNLDVVQSAVDNANNSDPGFSSDSANAQPDVISDIIVSTTPAELIQTNGQPAFSTIDGTNLAYVNNSQNDIFQSQSDQQYYVLISGRWYKSADLNGPWQYTAADQLPTDFTKIPEGSPKDNVLASVAGTPEAREAIMDAQIPQTAKVDRKTATANVTYDGDPQFDNIDGTDMQYGVNTQSSVIFDRGMYYSVDNGVWFQSNTASGPWAVCTSRPDDVDLIPPSYPVYNMKYVYVYDVNPDYVYMGYTPGYLNTYIYGPTVVYGTGYYYRPWYRHYYYPRAYTWGFNMHYNPWAGWSLGFGYQYNWFHVGFGVSIWGGWRGGWWGPAIYRPPYRSFAFRSYGYYGRGGLYGRPAIAGRPGFAGRPAARGNGFTNNIYNYRRDVVTTNNRRYNSFNRPAAGGINGRPAAGGINGRPAANNAGFAGRPASNTNVTTDRAGNVYQRSGDNQQWQQRQQNQWKPVANNRSDVIQNLNQQQQMHQRGQQRTQNFQTSRQATNNGGNRGGSRGGNSGGGGNHGGHRN